MFFNCCLIVCAAACEAILDNSNVSGVMLIKSSSHSFASFLIFLASFREISISSSSMSFSFFTSNCLYILTDPSFPIFINILDFL